MSCADFERRFLSPGLSRCCNLCHLFLNYVLAVTATVYVYMPFRPVQQVLLS